MNNAHVPNKSIVYLNFIIFIFVLGILSCVMIGVKASKLIASDTEVFNLALYFGLFIAVIYSLLYCIKLHSQIYFKETNLIHNNILPDKLQESVSLLKSEMTEVVLTRKEFNKISNAINHCTSEIKRFETELIPSVMRKVSELNLESNQKILEVEEQKKNLEGQIVDLMMSAERWEKLIIQDDPNIKVHPTKLIDDAEKIITGLKVIHPKTTETFNPENHEAKEILPGNNTLKITICNSRGFIFNNKVLKKAEVELEKPA